MSKALQKEATHHPMPTTNAPRTSRSARAGSSGRSPAGKAPVLTKDVVRRIGFTIAGKHWQADVAQMMEISKSQMTRWLNGSRTMPPTLNIAFEQVIYERLLALADCLVMQGMTQSKESQEVRDAIHDLVEPLLLRKPD